MEYPILYRGSQVGSLTVNSDGLYWQLTAWCSPFGTGVQRLYGAAGITAEPFGVFSPGDRGVSLHRRLSKHAFPSLPELWTAGREWEGFRPWQGSLEGQQISDALLRSGPAGQALALPVEAEPLPLAEYAPRMASVTLGDRAYLILPLQEGRPALPPEAAEPPEASALGTLQDSRQPSGEPSPSPAAG